MFEVVIRLVYLDIDGLEIPLGSHAEGGSVDTSRDVDALCQLVNVLERTLNTVEDGLHNAWTKFHGEGFTGPQHRVTNSNARSLFVHLFVFIWKCG